MNSKIDELISSFSVNGNTFQVAFLDFQESDEEVRLMRQIRREKAVDSIVDNIDNSKEIIEIDTFIRENNKPTLGPKVFSKNIKLSNKIKLKNIDDAHDLILNSVLQKIKSLCDTNKYYIESNNLTYFGGSKIEVDVSQIDDFESKKRRIISGCVSCSNIISTGGRIGPAKLTFMSSYLNSLIGEALENTGTKVIVDNTCANSIYLFRKSKNKESGLFLAYDQADNETIFYEVFEAGKAHKHFIRLDVIL